MNPLNIFPENVNVNFKKRGVWSIMIAFSSTLLKTDKNMMIIKHFET